MRSPITGRAAHTALHGVAAAAVSRPSGAVGLIVFAILVVTKGAERIAEVDARFMLDAMSGKQIEPKQENRELEGNQEVKAKVRRA